jgi:hypothetical protein
MSHLRVFGVWVGLDAVALERLGSDGIDRHDHRSAAERVTNTSARSIWAATRNKLSTWVALVNGATSTSSAANRSMSAANRSMVALCRQRRQYGG